MKKLLIPILLLTSFTAWAQKKHIYYDTIKTVSQRIDYAPDTIPVYFMEICIVIENKGTFEHYGKPDSIISNCDTVVYEKWHKGFVVWQTFKKAQPWYISGASLTMGTLSQPEYEKDAYTFSTELPGIFLYEDKKTHVTNKVIYSLKR